MNELDQSKTVFKVIGTHTCTVYMYVYNHCQLPVNGILHVYTVYVPITKAQVDTNIVTIVTLYTYI